jgi:hypothetical protein
VNGQEIIDWKSDQESALALFRAAVSADLAAGPEAVDAASRPFELLPIHELVRRGENDLAARCQLPITDIEHPYGYKFVANQAGDWWEIYWGGYSYPYENLRLKTPEMLLDFLLHVLSKKWDFVTSEKVSNFIGAVQHRNQFGLWHACSRDGDAREERAKMTPRLRFQTLRKAGFKCVACGLGPEHGAVLHADHIIPISKGGKTEERNLRSLCASCNFGKGTDL